MMNIPDKPNVITCINCGADVSKRASECPHCGTDEPSGVTCLICRKRTPYDPALVRKILWTNHRDSSHWQYYHDSCIKGLLASEYSVLCPDCHRNFGILNYQEVKDLESKTGGCPRCGSPELLINGKVAESVHYCFHCERHIVEGFQPYVVFDYLYYHKICFEISNPLQKHSHGKIGCTTTLLSLLAIFLLILKL